MLAKAPNAAAVVDPKTGLVTVEWLAYFQGLATLAAASTPAPTPTPTPPPATASLPPIISILPGSDVGSGTVGRLPKWLTATTLGDSIVAQAGSTVSVDGRLTAFSFIGDGSQLTDLNATQLTTGTLNPSRVYISAPSRLLGRGGGGMPGPMEEIALGPGLSMVGTVLSATGGGGGGGSSGSGTLGTLAKWTASTTLGDSIMTEAGGFLTVNGGLIATSPNALTAQSTAPGLYFWENPAPVNHRYWRQVVSGEAWYLQSLTDVGAAVANIFVCGRDGAVTIGKSLAVPQAVITAAVATNALTVQGFAASYTAVVISATPVGHGLYVAAGTSNTDASFVVNNRAETRTGLSIAGDMVAVFPWRLVVPVGTDLWAT